MFWVKTHETARNLPGTARFVNLERFDSIIIDHQGKEEEDSFSVRAEYATEESLGTIILFVGTKEECEHWAEMLWPALADVSAKQYLTPPPGYAK